MDKRIELQHILENILGSKEVYYQKPTNHSMTYPAILYSKSKIETKKADNSIYHKTTQYTVTLISRVEDIQIVDKILELPYCSYDRQYKSDGLYHDVFTIYY